MRSESFSYTRREDKTTRMSTTMSAAEMLATCLGWHEYVTQLLLTLPWFVSAAIFGIGQVYGSTLIMMFSMFLFLGHYQLVVFNGAIGASFTDPFCPLNTMLGGFSHTTFYVVAVTIFVLIFHAHNQKYPRIGVSCMLLVFFLVPPLVLIWLGVNSPQSVGVTLIVTTLLTFAFFAFALGFNFEPQWIVRTEVLEFFSSTNLDLVLTKEQTLELELDREVTRRLTELLAKYVADRDAWKYGMYTDPAHPIVDRGATGYSV